MGPSQQIPSWSPHAPRGRTSGPSQTCPILGGGIPAECQAGPHVAAVLRCLLALPSVPEQQPVQVGTEAPPPPQPSEASIPGSLPAPRPQRCQQPPSSVWGALLVSALS